MGIPEAKKPVNERTGFSGPIALAVFIGRPQADDQIGASDYLIMRRCVFS
jgi:hypothetical protein